MAGTTPQVWLRSLIPGDMAVAERDREASVCGGGEDGELGNDPLRGSVVDWQQASCLHTWKVAGEKRGVGY
jgi:hypothetical protein